jgi:superfamily II DNA or RNA helicase
MLKGYTKFNPHWDNPQKIYKFKAGLKELWKWQKECFSAIDEFCRFALIQAPCGSGKTSMQIALAIKDIIMSNWKRKQLIVVPDTSISKGFTIKGDLNYFDFMLNIKGRRKYTWQILPEHNFCLKEPKNIKRLKKWCLTSPEKLRKGFYGTRIIGGINAICCYSSLVAVWKSLTEEEKKIFIRNLTLRIDEAHHLNCLHMETELNEEELIAYEENMNQISDICQYILNSKTRSSKIHLSTATFFRGDRIKILSKNVRKRFTFYYLDWTEHFESLGIKSFEFKYEEYKGVNPIKEIIENIKKEPKEKHLIVIPPIKNKWRKSSSFKSLMSSIKKELPNHRVLDLVTKTTQYENRANHLDKEPESIKDGESKIDIVVACNLFNEGTDWCPCSRVHNTSCGNSITKEVQILGRLFRRFEPKETTKMISYIKTFKISGNEEQIRQKISDRTNTLLAAMQINEFTCPIIIELPNMPKKQNKVSLSECFRSQEEFKEVIDELIVEYEKLASNDRVSEETLYELAISIAEKHTDKEKVLPVAEGLIAKLFRMTNNILLEMPHSLEKMGLISSLKTMNYQRKFILVIAPKKKEIK